MKNEHDGVLTQTSQSQEASLSMETSMPNKQFKYQTKFNRPYAEGSGPRDVQNSQIYNEKLTSFVQEHLDYCKIDRVNHSIETVSSEVENYYKENLIRRFD